MSATTDPGAKQKNENVLIIRTKLGESVVEVEYNGVLKAILHERFDVYRGSTFVTIGLVTNDNNDIGSFFIDGEDIIVKEVFE